jgi:eukaryotic-like serine/threonine-protein kinase
MAAQTPGELLQWLAANEFLPAPHVAELQANLASFADRHAFVKDMVQRHWLTPYQANQILTDNATVLILGPFRILERIGEGAMGQVFKAWHVLLGKFVAVKMIHQHLLANAKVMDRFRQEMAAAAQLAHPNIVLVRDAREIDHRPYMVMEYCEGINLSQLVKKHGALPIHLACDYIRQAAAGLQHAFEQGVVHRDLKPSNLLLTSRQESGVRGLESGGWGQVKILDFGLARATTQWVPGRLTLIGNILGTVDYVSPEQIENAQNADVRSDIYSLGCTLFLLLSARKPFVGTSLTEKVSGRLLGEVPNILEACPNVPPALDSVMRRMMAHKPDDRFQTPTELAQALAPFCRATAVPVAPEALPTAPVPQARLVTALQHQGLVPTAVSPTQSPHKQILLPGPNSATAIPASVSKTMVIVLVGGALVLLLLGVLIAALRADPGTRSQRSDQSRSTYLSRLPAQQIQHRHAHGQPVGHLLENG